MTNESELYYLHDSRRNGIVGNCMMFWRKGNSGYTYNLDDCQLFTKDEAFAQHQRRETDIPYLKSVIDKLSERHIDHQDLNKWESDNNV